MNKTIQKPILKKIEKLVTPYIGTLFPGCIIGCANQRHQFVQAYGKRGENGDMKKTYIFDTASVTKAILNVITLNLIPFKELDRSIIEYVSMTGKYRDKITIRHLLTFGVEYGDTIRLSQVKSRDDLGRILVNGDLPFLPGTSYRYTNISSMLLTLYLERRFGTTFEFLVQKFCSEIGMADTGFYPFNLRSLDEIVPTEKDLREGAVQDESARLYGKPIGSAGLFSTANGLLSFGQSFLGDKTYLAPKTIKRMSVSQFENVALSFGLGMGLRHQNECDLYNSDGTPMVVLKKNGYSGIHFCVLPENDFCFVVFANICYWKRPTAEKRDMFTFFHKKMLRLLYESQGKLF